MTPPSAVLWVRDDETHVVDADVNSARLILISLIYAVPTILLIDGPIIRGLVAATLSGGIAVIAGTIRQGETEFLLTVIKPLIAIAIIPVLFMLFQVLPLKTTG